MDASCGPSNALQNLSKHTQRDNTLQNEFIGRNQHQQPGQGFRSNVRHVDQNLNQEFQQFNGGSQINNSFMNQLNAPQGFNHVQQHRQPQQNVHKQQPAWVQDFSNMSINQRQQPVAQLQHIQSDWHQQFMNQQANHQQHQQQHQPQANQFNQRIAPNYTSAFNMNMRTNLSSPAHSQMGVPTEHQEIHNLEQERLMFDDQFDQLEKELASQEVEQPEVQQQAEPQVALEGNELEKEEFANTARKVQQSMTKSDGTRSTETNSKFEQSEFLKLMNSISNRSVELSDQGDKLVNKQGEDIREHLSDPLSEVRSQQPEPDTQINYHQPMHDIGPVPSHFGNPTNAPVESSQPELRSHLPDPLAHIKDGALGDMDGPLQAARIISGGQVNANDWMEDDMWSGPNYGQKGSILDSFSQEVFDDYRHDDDAH